MKITKCPPAYAYGYVPANVLFAKAVLPKVASAASHNYQDKINKLIDTAPDR